MFSYYGSKSKIVNHYPAPSYDTIIEPFAGSARYSLKYFEKNIILVDKYDVVCDIWRWLQQCSEEYILSFPSFEVGDRILIEYLDCKEQYELIRLLLQQGTVGGNKAYQWGIKSYRQNLKQIAGNLHKIRHWEVVNGDYGSIENRQATWFIDPPYQFGGHKYKCSNKKIDYDNLKDWSTSRIGESIICENAKANWMPFEPLVDMQGIRAKTTECVLHLKNPGNGQEI